MARVDEHVDEPTWLSQAISRPVVRRALAYAIVVGLILIVINHGDSVIAGEVSSSRLAKMGLTMLVPYVVSTLSSVGALRQGNRSIRLRGNKT